MTLTPDDDLNETARQRTRDQIALLRQAFGTSIIVDTDDDADFTFVCHSERLLVNPEDAAEVEGYFADDQNGVFDPEHPGHWDEDTNRPREELFRRYVVPRRLGAVPGDRGLLLTLDELDRDRRPDLGVPDHLVHICPRASQCPATEPTETSLKEPWPPKVLGNAGQGVSVVVIDTGWYDPTAEASPPEPALPWDHLGDVAGQPEPQGVLDALHHIRPYAGHGTFVAGVVRSMAPKCSIYVLNLPSVPAPPGAANLAGTPNQPPNPYLPEESTYPGGGLFESDLVTQLDAAVDRHPHLISLSAGCPTRHNRPARSFEKWWEDVSKHPGAPLVVAAAGNNSSPWGFWPASFEWALGVGSLDRDGTVSDFSNYGDSADVYALGRNLVNAFPNGTYVCHESPDRQDERVFTDWYARWSGTSFSTPLITGLIAAAMSPQGAVVMDAEQAKNTLLGVTPQKWSLKMREVPVVRGDLLVPQL
jgi:subtilisin family serine protease